MKKSKKNIKTIKKTCNKLIVLSIVSLINLVVFSVLILKINILSLKYSILIIFLLLIINLLGLLLLSRKSKIISKLGIIILSISIILVGVGSYYLYYIDNFLDKSFNSERKYITTYYILTSSSNKYSSKKDIKGNVYYYANSSNNKSILKKIREDFNIKVSPYDNIISMLKDTVNKKIDFMLIDENSYNIILNLDKDIEQGNLKIVYKFKVEDMTKNNKKEKPAYNIYIRGIDTDGLSDYNAIVTVNTITHEVLLTSIPRDYYMEIYGTNGKKDSLSHMFIYPEGTSRKSLEKFFGISLDYSVDITPEGVVDLVNQLGGITYCSDQSFNAYIPDLNTKTIAKAGWIRINKGCQVLDGSKTYAVAHERNSFVGRDRMRQKNCQKIIIAIFERLKSTNSFVNYKGILESLNNLYTTDIPRRVITSIAKDTIDGAEWKFITQSVDGSDKWDADIAILNDKGYAMIPNESDVINATNKINETLKKK